MIYYIVFFRGWRFLLVVAVILYFLQSISSVGVVAKTMLTIPYLTLHWLSNIGLDFVLEPQRSMGWGSGTVEGYYFLACCYTFSLMVFAFIVDKIRINQINAPYTE